jgi:hypothetical protein
LSLAGMMTHPLILYLVFPGYCQACLLQRHLLLVLLHSQHPLLLTLA